MHFDQPQLKRGCKVHRSAEGISLSYLGNDFTMEFDEPGKADAIEALLGRLDGQLDLDQLQRSGVELSGAEFDEALALLDENLLLTEGTALRPGKSGIAFVTEIEDLYYNIWVQEDGETKLAQQLFDGEAERPVVLGWCLESFHVTRRAHDCLAPVIARAHGTFKVKAIDYFLDEYRHDKLIMKSLTAAGFAREQIAASLPLPYTHAVMNLLAKWANSDLLSFMACLFVFEGTPEIGNAYIESLAHYDLEADFVKGQSVHNDINNEGDHGNVTRDFYKLVEQVSPADQARVIVNLRLLYEAQRCKHDTLLRYYLAPTIGIPRHLKPEQRHRQEGTDSETEGRERPGRRSLDRVLARVDHIVERRRPPVERAACDAPALARMLPQLRYVHERLIDCLSTALDRVRPDSARYALSQMLVRQCQSWQQRATEDAEAQFQPLPAVEAIANQLQVLALNDWPVFLALLPTCVERVFELPAWRDRLANHGEDTPDPVVDLAFLTAAGDLRDLRACLRMMEPANEAASHRAEAEAVILMEMTCHLREELAEDPRGRTIAIGSWQSQVCANQPERAT